MTLTTAFWAAAFLLTSNGTSGPVAAGSADRATGVLFGETFDDARLTERGWYDGRTFAISREGTRAGGGCIEYHWKPGTTTPERSSGLRRLFEPTDTVYLRFYIKLSPGWGWTGRSYHPHLMHLLTTENDKYHGPAASHLTLYIEPQEGKLRLAAQDIQNQDKPHGLTQGPLRGGYNGTFYDSKDVLFTDDAWHCVEAMFKLNSLDPDRDRANGDGIVRRLVRRQARRGAYGRGPPLDRFPEHEIQSVPARPLLRARPAPARADLVDRRAGGRDRAVGADRAGSRLRRASRSASGFAGEQAPMRVAAAQPRNRTIDFRLRSDAALAEVDRSLAELVQLVRKAGEAGCDALALPEDTLGLLKWETANPESLGEVLPEAVRRMLDRLGRAAADHRMYLVLCNDVVETDGRVYNTSFLLGRDGKEIGRYHKVNLPLAEQSRARGRRFPVFPTPDLGTVGMLICYDMVFPEAARCLALEGADVVFHPTLGGAAIGDEDISLAAFRTRAVDNFIYLVVAMRGQGSMIISPQGKVVATAKGPDALAIAEIDPSGGREGGDAFNTQARHAGPAVPRTRAGGLRHPHRSGPARARQGPVERDQGRGHSHHGDGPDHRRGTIQRSSRPSRGLARRKRRSGSSSDSARNAAPPGSTALRGRD